MPEAYRFKGLPWEVITPVAAGWLQQLDAGIEALRIEQGLREARHTRAEVTNAGSDPVDVAHALREYVNYFAGKADTPLEALAVLLEVRDHLDRFLQAMHGDFGNDHGVGFEALADAVYRVDPRPEVRAALEARVEAMRS